MTVIWLLNIKAILYELDIILKIRTNGDLQPELYQKKFIKQESTI